MSGCDREGADAGIVKKLNSAGKSQGTIFPDREDYYGVFVLDDNNAWAVGGRGIILHLTDKATKATILPSGVEVALYNVDFIDAQNGIAVGQDGLIIKTNDGGKTWRQIKIELPLEDWRPSLPHIFSISRGTDPQKIWAVGPGGTVIRSDDGGETWQDLSLHRDVTLNGVSFASDTEGWVVGEFGSILHTSDGGQTWQEQKNVQNLPKYTRPDLSEEDAIKQRVPQLYLEDLFLVAVSFRNPREGYIAAESGILLKTEDGGENWTNLPSGSFNTLLSVTAAEGQHKDVITGVLGTLGSQTDGKWEISQEVRSHVLTWLRNASFAKNGSFGLACGGKGTILVTQDGGSSWKSLAKETIEQATASLGKSA
jgi:photosystem II stability/assembly factor-like uncharacterized protein